MVRMLLACSMLALVAVTAGCSMCAHPFDYCGPLASGGCGGQACMGPRAGTVRNPGDPVTGSGVVLTSGEEVYYDETVPQPMGGAPVGAAPPAPAPVAGSPSRVVAAERPAPARATATARAPYIDVRKSLPESAQILSITDETLAEVQARKAGSSLADRQPTPAAPRTAQRWSGVKR
jgi:hypothetical protein